MKLNFFVPLSHSVRQTVLDFLAEKRKATDLKKNDVSECAYSKTEIATQLNIERVLVDQQLDVLYALKQVEAIRYNKDENKFFITDIGFFATFSKEPLNEGKLLNSQIISNYTNSFFQIVTGVIALYTIYKSYVTTDAQNTNIELLKKSISRLEEQSKPQQKTDLLKFPHTLDSTYLETNKSDSTKNQK